jgi:urease accessory protein
VLKEQWVRPPLHLAKTYHDKDWAINLLTSPTAGLLEGDRLEVDCRVEAKARAALVSPAACRVHTMKDSHATIRQSYKVGAHAVLDIWPAPLVLQKNCRLIQETSLEVEDSSTVLLTEILSPGRARYGESFEFHRWASKLRIYRSGTLISYENFRVDPKNGDAADWKRRFSEGSYASIYLLTSQPIESLIEPLNELSGKTAAVGGQPPKKWRHRSKTAYQGWIGIKKNNPGASRNVDTPHGRNIPRNASKGTNLFLLKL